MATFAPPPGTADIFPEEARRWRNLEAAAGTVFSRYGYGELRTPIFEYTEVFQRGLGDETEVVQKEMYTFLDRGGRSLTLRPEGTAGVMRALSNTDVLNGVEQRVYYHGPMFRGERPAAGRRRQFHQIGVENVGRIAPLIDAECIAMLMEFLREIGIPDAKLSINTRGVMPDRGPAGQLLRDYFGSRIHEMCDDCKARLERNVWRILDCKQEACRKFVADAPDYVASFSAESRAYFDEVKAALTALGVEYTVDPLLVRGLDYYVHTVFEVTHTARPEPSGAGRRLRGRHGAAADGAGRAQSESGKGRTDSGLSGRTRRRGPHGEPQTRRRAPPRGHEGRAGAGGTLLQGATAQREQGRSLLHGRTRRSGT